MFMLRLGLGSKANKAIRINSDLYDVLDSQWSVVVETEPERFVPHTLYIQYIKGVGFT